MSVEEKINSLIADVEQEFYEKKKQIIEQLSEIEKKKEEEHDKIKSKVSLLQAEEKKQKAKLKELIKELNLINSKLTRLKKRKITDEKKLEEYKKIQKEYPLILKSIDLYDEEKSDLVTSKKKIQRKISSLQKRIRDKLRKADEIKESLKEIDKSEYDLKKKKISPSQKKKLKKSK